MARSERNELLIKLEKAKSQVEIGAEYQHTKSKGNYIVLDIVIREDNEEIRVIYKELDHMPQITWDRSFDGEDGWIVPTELNGEMFPRFSKKNR